MIKKKSIFNLLKRLRLQYLFAGGISIFLMIFLIRMISFMLAQPNSSQWNLTRTKNMFSSTNDIPSLKVRQHGQYWILYNYVIAEQHLHANKSITLTTHCDYKNLRHLSTLVHRWRAPISVAIFASGSDFNSTINAIKYLYDCGPQRALIRRHVTFSLCIHTDHQPVNVPSAEKFIFTFGCTDCKFPFQSKRATYREQHKLEYPVNLLRNIGRQTARTYFTLPLEIYVLPSPGFVDKFLSFSQALGATYSERSVFCLFTFEVPKSVAAKMPTTKKDLKTFVKHFLPQSTIEPPEEGFEKNDTRWAPFLTNFLQKTWLNYRPSANEAYDLMYTASTKLICELQFNYVTVNELEPLYDEEYMLSNSKNLESQHDLLRHMKYTFYLMDKAFLLKRNGAEAVSRLPNEINANAELTPEHLLYKMKAEAWRG